MAIIPSGQKFHTVASNVVTKERGSALVNSQKEIFTMQDIVNTSSSYFVSLAGKATNGTNVNGTTITKSSSILINANTYTSGDILNIDCSFIVNTFSPTQIMSVYVYTNTTDTLTGATLLGKVIPTTLKGYVGMSRSFYVSPTQYGSPIKCLVGLDEMTSTFNSNQSSVDYYTSITFNYTVNQYIIFACKVADTSYPVPEAHLNHAFITKL